MEHRRCCARRAMRAYDKTRPATRIQIHDSLSVHQFISYYANLLEEQVRRDDGRPTSTMHIRVIRVFVLRPMESRAGQCILTHFDNGNAHCLGSPGFVVNTILTGDTRPRFVITLCQASKTAFRSHCARPLGSEATCPDF